MQVKVFEADDMKSALRQVKETLGAEALILSTRSVRRGGMGRLGKPRLEVTAAVEAPPAEAQPLVRSAGASAPPPRRAPIEEDISYADIWKNRRVIDPLEEEVEGLKGHLSSLNIEELRGEIRDLKKMFETASVPGAGARTDVPRSALEGAASRKGWVATLADILSAYGLEGEVEEAMVRIAMGKLTTRQKENPQVLKAFARQAIAHLVKVSGPLAFEGRGPRTVALVGPTGVGKTTTVAKLAADHLLRQGRRVALVTIDIYRIAAAEQLKVYGEIMDLPVDVAISPEQFRQQLAKHRDKELILVDTAGRSPKDGLGLEEMAAFLGEESGVENHLVLAANTREREISSAVQSFGRLPISSLLFTKLDECETLGALLNVQQKFPYPLSYVTNGQRVPEDLLLAEPKGIANLIMGTH
ncbi:flagellar biosynthesis protein FlhF [uncultured Desulfuromonas sp.]|uniref:flagellar biosynthesis protein FlhF n=1 Tax=uncultured Desulfuromonas sp. TaxID=181013 RepID=UPI0026349C4D|nr:flagellar biosynthesis protein FlhF [uncultured Desulfuromonas sp.]